MCPLHPQPSECGLYGFRKAEDVLRHDGSVQGSGSTMKGVGMPWALTVLEPRLLCESEGVQTHEVPCSWACCQWLIIAGRDRENSCEASTKIRQRFEGS